MEFGLRWTAAALLALAVGTAAGCRRPQVANELEVSGERVALAPAAIVDDAEDRRAYSSELAALADSNDRDLRARLATALGRIGDGRAAPTLARLLVDPDPAVRESAAFALGLLGDRAGRAAIDLLAGSPGVPAAMAIDAVGRSGGAADLPWVAGHLAAADPAVRADAARALGLLGQRGVAPDAATVAALVRSLADSEEPVRFMAVFALFRGGFAADPGAATAPLRRAAADDPSAEIRALALRALAKGGALDTAEHERAMVDADYRVAATAMLVIGDLPEERRCPAVARALEAIAVRLQHSPADAAGTYAHVARTALEQAGGCAAAAGVAGAATRIEGTLPKPGQTAGEARIRCLARLAGGRDELALLACDPDRPHVGKRMLIRRLAALKPAAAASVSSLAALAAEPDPRVVAPALEALAAIDRDDARAAVLAALDSDRPLTVSSALDGIAAAKDAFAAIAPAVVAKTRAVVDRFDPTEGGHAPLLSAIGALGAVGGEEAIALLARLVANPRPELRAAAEEALAKLPGAIVPAPLPPLAPLRPTSHVRPAKWAGARVVATVSTTRGAFAIELDPEVAPATVESFVELAGRGFFAGTEIHRVVPNFVVQAGDPTGSGMGDAGYTLRCELSGVPYVRGTVGMALSGKDTGGSQFFIALSRQPHLDGRYTAFGKVISGMEVLDLLEEGDAIERVEVEVAARGAPPEPAQPR